MTGMLLDTTVLIDLLRGNETAADFVDAALPDALIAATALAQELELASDNVRHFGMIPSLQLTRPY